MAYTRSQSPYRTSEPIFSSGALRPDHPSNHARRSRRPRPLVQASSEPHAPPTSPRTTRRRQSPDTQLARDLATMALNGYEDWAPPPTPPPPPPPPPPRRRRYRSLYYDGPIGFLWRTIICFLFLPSLILQIGRVAHTAGLSADPNALAVFSCNLPHAQYWPLRDVCVPWHAEHPWPPPVSNGTAAPTLGPQKPSAPATAMLASAQRAHCLNTALSQHLSSSLSAAKERAQHLAPESSRRQFVQIGVDAEVKARQLMVYFAAAGEEFQDGGTGFVRWLERFGVGWGKQARGEEGASTARKVAMGQGIRWSGGLRRLLGLMVPLKQELWQMEMQIKSAIGSVDNVGGSEGWMEMIDVQGNGVGRGQWTVQQAVSWRELQLPEEARQYKEMLYWVKRAEMLAAQIGAAMEESLLEIGSAVQKLEDNEAARSSPYNMLHTREMAAGMKKVLERGC